LEKIVVSWFCLDFNAGCSSPYPSSDANYAMHGIGLFFNIRIYTGGAKECIHILRDDIYVLLFEVELNYGSSV
jgi:hypothetical protein